MSKQTQTLTVAVGAEAAFAALKTAVEKLKYTIDTCDEAAYTLTIKTRVSAFSWGEIITVTVTPEENGGSQVELHSQPKLATNVVDMGRAKRELTAIANALEEELKGGKEAAPAAQPAAAPQSGMAFVADEIRALAKLRDEGILTDEEFAAKKKQLLGI